MSIAMARPKTSRWDVVDHLKTEIEIEEYRSAVMEDGDPEVIAAAMQDIDRARELLARQNSV
jgi:probable addiction module antidote protein